MSGSSKGTPLRSALKTDDDGENRTPPCSGSLKAVQIAEAVPEYRTFEEDAQPVKQFRTSHNRRLSGKMPSTTQVGTSSRSSVSANDSSPLLRPTLVDDAQQGTGHHHRHGHHTEKLVAQVTEWLERQQAKQTGKGRPRHHLRHRKHHAAPVDSADQNDTAEASSAAAPGPDDSSKARERADSLDSQSSDMSLSKLAKILEESRVALGLGSGHHHRPSLKAHRPRNRRRSISQRTVSSDTDYMDGDVIVPDCDVVLDNTKAMSYSGGGASTPADDTDPEARKDQDGWHEFKNEVIRTTHTLRLKGWRRVPLGGGDLITVERICGALTNAVYSVTPPSDLPKEEGKKKPAKLLLRIYGPQVEHLIDRDLELGVLQRLARKKIGPRLLGTFRNGRFEQYFNASPLTPPELRDPDVSRQIAKRTRELHAGIDLLPNERDEGPSVWKSVDKWEEKATAVMSFVDREYEKAAASGKGRRAGVYAWRNNGYVCGVPYPQFKDALTRYRQRLDQFYAIQAKAGSKARRWGDDPQQTRLAELTAKLERQEADLKQRSATLQNGIDDIASVGRKTILQNLVFAHNDTQYGNILRFQPDDEKSPLLQPANKHKQLVVIDFEYAAANMPGYEFANHFIEWTYNYHATVGSHLCDTTRYPRPEEQYRYLKAYVDHRPQFPHVNSTPRLTPVDAANGQQQQQQQQSGGPGSTTPKLLPANSSSSIVDFMLDSRAPPGGWSAAEKAREEQMDRDVRQLMDDAMLWRPASSAFWITWGLIQASVPGLEEGDEYDELKDEAGDKAEADSDEFDYLGYSQNRAYFFWGDMVQLGIVKPEELPEELRSRLKLVDC